MALYLIDVVTDRSLMSTMATTKPPAGPGWTEADLTPAAALQIEGTTALDDNEFTRWTLLDGSGTVIDCRDVDGY